MSLSADILGAWRQGWGRALRRQIAAGAGEERALGWLILATVLLIVAQAPASYRNVLANVASPDEVPIAFIMSSVFTLFLAPLTFYGLATGPYLNARLALFWALLCAAPFVLLGALATNIVGPTFAKPLELLVFIVFLLIWADTMTVAESLRSRRGTGLALLAIASAAAARTAAFAERCGAAFATSVISARMASGSFRKPEQ